MPNNKMFILKIKSTDLGQIVDGLKQRAEAYRRTERYYIEGTCDGEIEEVVDEVEAADIAQTYEGIIECLESQAARQRFMEDTISEHLTNTGGN